MPRDGPRTDFNLEAILTYTNIELHFESLFNVRNTYIFNVI